jgi:predicted murein hydrolase (TIGR00659 family)
MAEAPLDRLFELWVFLQVSPLFWLTATVVAWVAAQALAERSGRHPLVNPVLIAMLLVGALVVATRTAYATYFAGAQFVHFLLGPATVAIAVPLFRHAALIRRHALAIGTALVAGSLVAVASAIAIGRALGLPPELLTALAPKSVTAAVAMGITQQLGGDPTLTAVLVITTGIIGAIVVTPLMDALRVRDYAARGFAVGLAAHGIGTARAFTVDPIAGTFAGLAMGLNAVLTALLVPLFLPWLR